MPAPTRPPPPPNSAERITAPRETEYANLGELAARADHVSGATSVTRQRAGSEPQAAPVTSELTEGLVSRPLRMRLRRRCDLDLTPYPQGDPAELGRQRCRLSPARPVGGWLIMSRSH